jgi:hypothetical protein
MAQAVEHLPSKGKALSWNPSTAAPTEGRKEGTKEGRKEKKGRGKKGAHLHDFLYLKWIYSMILSEIEICTWIKSEETENTLTNSPGENNT